MIVVDSSVWIEILADGPLRSACEQIIDREQPTTVLVPTLVFFEVYKKIKEKVSEEDALSVVATLASYRQLPLTMDVSLAAADLSLDLKMPMADSIVLAHARLNRATLLTLDNDFADIPDAKVLRARK